MREIWYPALLFVSTVAGFGLGFWIGVYVEFLRRR